MPRVQEEEINAAFQKLVDKWKADQAAFDVLPKEEQDRILAEEHNEFLRKMGWGYGLLPMNFDPQKYGTIAA